MEHEAPRLLGEQLGEEVVLLEPLRNSWDGRSRIDTNYVCMYVCMYVSECAVPTLDGIQRAAQGVYLESGFDAALTDRHAGR